MPSRGLLWRDAFRLVPPSIGKIDRFRLPGSGKTRRLEASLCRSYGTVVIDRFDPSCIPQHWYNRTKTFFSPTRYNRTPP